MLKRLGLVFSLIFLVMAFVSGIVMAEYERGLVDLGVGPIELPLVEETVSIEWLLPERASAPVQEDWPVVEKIYEDTNIDINFIPVPSSGYDDKRNILIATNELPDISYLTAADAAQFGPDGVVIDLKPLIDEYAPHIKALFDKYPNAPISVRGKDGGIYGIPAFDLEPGKFHRMWFARKDLVEDYGLDYPETTDELYQFLKVFQERNPGSYPLVPRSSYNLYEAMHIAFMGDNRVAGGIIFDNEEEKYLLAPEHEGFKDMITFLNKLYKERLLDMEYASIDDRLWEQKLLNEKGFVTYAWRTRGAFFNRSFKKTNPDSDYNLFAMPPLAAPTGRRVVFKPDPVGGSVWSISSNCDSPVAAVKLLDYLVSEKGQILTNYGIEGLSHEKNAAGKVVKALGDFNDPTHSSEKCRQIGARYDGFRIIGLSDLSAPGEEFIKRDEIIGPFLVPDNKPLPSTPEIIEVEKEYHDTIDQYYTENLTKFVMGRTKITDENIDNLIQELKDMGGREIVDTYNDVYQEYFGN